MADREPCPWRIVDDVGGAFCMGAIGGGIWHTVKGARLAPVGSRLQGSLSAVQARAPVLGGQFAVWGCLFACCDCTMSGIRQKVGNVFTIIRQYRCTLCTRALESKSKCFVSIQIILRRIPGILLSVERRLAASSQLAQGLVLWPVERLLEVFSSRSSKVWE